MTDLFRRERMAELRAEREKAKRDQMELEELHRDLVYTRVLLPYSNICCNDSFLFAAFKFPLDKIERIADDKVEIKIFVPARDDNDLKGNINQIERIYRNSGWHWSGSTGLDSGNNPVFELENANVAGTMGAILENYGRLKYLLMHFEALHDVWSKIENEYYTAIPRNSEKAIERDGLKTDGEWISSAREGRIYMALTADEWISSASEGRIYMALTADEAVELWEHFSLGDNENCVVVKIRTEEIGKPIRVFRDISLPVRGYYTLSEIPAEAIEVVA